MAFNFGAGTGGVVPTPVAAAAPSFGFSNSNSSTGGTQHQQHQQQPLPVDIIAIPTFNELLPGRSIWYKIDNLLQTMSSSLSSHVDSISNGEIDEKFKAKQELIQILKDVDAPNGIAQQLLLNSRTKSAVEKVSPDNTLRQRLQQRPIVSLSIEKADGTVMQQEAAITPNMLHDICLIADDLMVSEVVAISLYQQAASSDVPFQSKFVHSILKNSTVTVDATSVPWMAREIYYSQTSLILHSCLLLLQNRLRENDSESSLNPVTEATDYLLQSGWMTNLIQVVRDNTQRINMLLVQNNEGRPIPGNYVVSSIPSSNETSTHFWRNEVVLQTCYRERQLASECLYFIAYHTQLEGDEIVALMDLLRDVTNDCVKFDPYTDVPDPMEAIPFGNTGTSMTPSSFNFNSAAPWFAQQPQREKDTLVWEQELVTTAFQTGQPQLLRCGCTVLVAIFSSLGDKASLIDRRSHVPNSIGNALFPPGSSSIGRLDVIQKCLHRDSIATWKRPDVLGLVMASYAMLLQSSPVIAMHERNTDSVSDIVRSFQEHIVISLELKSFSFARLSLIPALRMYDTVINDYANAVIDSCDVTEFFLSSLAEFASHYMDVMSTLDHPLISRAKWERDAEEDLKNRRELHEQEQSLRGNFPKWSDPVVVANNSNEIPNQVDLLARPDCVDDVVALSTAIGVLGPDYAMQFWSRKSIATDAEEDTYCTKLIRSRAVIWLEQQQRDDESLRPVYLSFLAALAVAKNPSNNIIGSGADEVYGFITAEGDDGGTGWSALIELFRWYIRQLSPEASTTRAPSTSVSSSGGSTAYYYSDQDDTSGTDAVFATRDRTKSGEAVSQSRPRELGEANEFILFSNLAILANIATFSTTARSSIIGIHLPIIESDGTTVGQESVLAILFTLAVMPLSPDIRGSVFHTIAKLLSIEGLSNEEREETRQTAIKGWEILEEYQILPIHLLQQYPSIHDPSFHGAPSMSFPPSSSALAIGKSVQLWIPPDPRYAIIYEMEFVESRRGCYPSTEGFLELLSALFSVGGFPSMLGRNWRPRTGCTPYIEYIIDYVLPRVTGRFERYPPLPFRSMQDKSRLTAMALAVVDIVLARYHIAATKPTLELSMEIFGDNILKASEDNAKQELGITDLAVAVTVRPHAEDFKHMIDDYISTTSRPIDSLPKNEHMKQLYSQQPTIAHSPVPRPKSPGFSVLAAMLSSKRQTLFHAVVSPVFDRQRIQPTKIDSNYLSLVYALYISTPPTFTSAKDGARRSWPLNARQSLLTSLRPSSYINEQGGSVESEVASILRIFCGILAKEKTFRQQITLTGQTTYVPVLRFTKKSSLPTTIDLQPAKLAHLLVSSEIETGIVSSIVDLVGYFSKMRQASTEIAAMATSVSFYIERSVSPKQALELFSCKNPRQINGGLVHAFTTRFTLAVSSALSEPDSTLLMFIFDRLLMDLRTETSYGTLAEVMFGEKTTYLKSANLFRCIDVMLLLLDNVDFSFREVRADVVSSCYETFYRLITIGNGNRDIEISLLVAAHLRTRDFWTLGLLKLCSAYLSMPKERTITSNYHLVHSIAWLFKGIACELRILSGISREYIFSPELERLAASHPILLKQLMDVLFAEQGLIAYALCLLPIERPNFSAISVAPSDEKCVVEAKIGLCGALEVVYGYDLLSFDKLNNLLKTKKYTIDEHGLHSWVEHWNHSVYMDCSSAHLSDSIRLVIETSLACNDDRDFAFSPGLTMGKATIFHLLSCMTPAEDCLSNIESIDVTYFTTACRNVASAACMVSFAIGEQWRDIDVEALPALIVKAIACSVAENRSGAEFTRIKERIAALAGALIPILRAFPKQLIQDDNGRFWFQAAVAIAQLGTKCDITTFKKLPTTASNEDRVMRICLCEMLENLEASDKSYGFSSSLAVLTFTSSSTHQTTPIQCIIDLLKSFDESVAPLALRLISISSDIADLFITSGMLEALQQAAEIYLVEEKRFLVMLASNVNSNAAQIQIPTFLVGHFEIISALLTSQVSPALLRDSLQKIVTLLLTYAPLFERLVTCFPIGGDALYAMLRCITQANALISKKSQLGTFTVHETQNQTLTKAELSFSSFLGPVTKLVVHIAENPLPSRMLDPIPSCLSTPQISSGLVSLIASSVPTWWDTQETQLVDIDDICRIATLGMDLVRFGALLIRRSDSRSTLDEYSLSRCICRCTDAASKIESALRPLRQGQNIKSPHHVEDLATLRSKIIDVLEAFLFLSLSYVQDNKSEQSLRTVTPRAESYSNTLTFALDYTRLDVLNPGSNSFYGEDENYPTLVSELSCVLRSKLNQNGTQSVKY